MPSANPRRAIESILRTQVRNYSEPARVQAHAEQLLSNIASLSPKVGTLTHNNGTQSLLMTLAGTIPIRYGGNQYNIPVELFIPETYPTHPAILYVRPTPSMLIKQGHRHVDGEGLVYLPYLNQWRPRSSSLLELCNAASAVFSSEPPVFARPKDAAVHQAQPVIQPIQAHVKPTVAQAAYATSANTHQSSNVSIARPEGSTASSKTSRQQLMGNVAQRLQEEMVKADSGIRHDIEIEVETQGKLQQAQLTIAADLASLQTLKERLQKGLDGIPEKEQALGKWHEELTQAEATEDVENLIFPVDIPSRQLLDAMAEYHAIEDTLYFMDRAIAASVSQMTLDAFLKEARRLAGKQFLAKCLVNKIAQACN